MKIYQTNAALGYSQLAFLIRLHESLHGYNYLCIGTRGISDNEFYKVGELVLDLEDIYIEDSNFGIKDSPLKGSYLFDFWVANYKEPIQPLYSTPPEEQIKTKVQSDLVKNADVQTQSDMLSVLLDLRDGDYPLYAEAWGQIDRVVKKLIS